jgi:type II secretory pathway component PulF
LKKTGILTASSEREARRYIKELQLTPVSVSIANKRSSFRSRIKNKEIVLMTRQLATLLEANTSIIDALKITADQLNNNDLIGIILNLREDLIQGKRLGQSMKKYPTVFNNTYSSLVTAGDSSGNLISNF